MATLREAILISILMLIKVQTVDKLKVVCYSPSLRSEDKNLSYRKRFVHQVLHSCMRSYIVKGL